MRPPPPVVEILARIRSDHVKALAWRFTLTTLPTFVALGLQFLAFVVLARALGAMQFGLYTGLSAVAAIGLELIGLGGGDVLVRAVARHPDEFRVRFGAMLTLIAATLPPVIAATVVGAVLLSPEPVGVTTALMILAGDLTLGRVAASVELVMVAYGHTVRAGAVRLATATGRLSAALAFQMLGGGELADWAPIGFAQTLATAAIFLVAVALLYGRPLFGWRPRLWHEGLGFMLNQMARAAQGSFDRLVLSGLADAATLGTYGAASRLISTGVFPIQVATRMTYPHYFVHGEGGIGPARRYALRCAGPLVAVGAASGVGVAAAAWVVAPILGPGFDGTAAIAAKLALAMPLIALQYPPADALTGADRQALRVKLFITVAVLTALGLVMGARLGGVDGLIAAFVVGQGILAAALWIAAFRVADAAGRGGATGADRAAGS